MHFYEKYFSISMRNVKDLEFMSLHQGTMTITKYTTKFKELCKFLMIYQRNLDEQWKYVKFERRLREHILASIGPMEIHDYVALVNKCRSVEDGNCKLVLAKSKAHKTKLVPQEQNFKQ